MYIHIILKITEGQTFLLLQISTVSTAPDYFLTRRQKRWGSDQTRRANEDLEANYPFAPGHNTADIPALLWAWWEVIIRSFISGQELDLIHT